MAAQRPKAPVAIITGAGHGIGRAITLRLLQDNWRVGIVDLAAAGLKRGFGTHRARLVHTEGDVADEQTARRSVETVMNAFGRLDALISNAGIMIRKPLRKLSLAEWHRVFDTNLTATFLFARAAEKPLRAAKGAIVTIASTRALMSEPNTESYSASKGGLRRADACAGAQPCARMCGSTASARAGSSCDRRRKRKLRRKDHAQHPVGRVGKPEDIAEVAAFLIDRERTGFITGANFIVDGGMTRKMIYEE